jgi:hypothetical protein
MTHKPARHMKNTSTTRAQKRFLEQFRGRVDVVHGAKENAFIRRFVAAVRPHMAVGAGKIRLGGRADGGYVMLDPGANGLAYSFGVSDSSPWDLALAELGFKVYQYDGSIEQAPDAHPNLFFQRSFISGAALPPPGSLNLMQVIERHGHQAERDLILQMDIEGEEWEVLANLPQAELMRFSQLIVEFHDLAFAESRLAVLEKLLETHLPVHFHYNNCVQEAVYCPAGLFVYAHKAMEITYARRADYEFIPCAARYPTSLDCPNEKKYLDIPIGYFDALLDNFGG